KLQQLGLGLGMKFDGAALAENPDVAALAALE
ncbi:MAG: hypothetical protein QOD99_1871, partial [Chthoniobacter sp.]|nr:hypothetical protein [Chthoniobacter sp.]